MRHSHILKSLVIIFMSFACLRYYLASPVYVLADIFYYMPRSAFDSRQGEGKKGMTWFPVTRLKHHFDCVISTTDKEETIPV